MNAGIFGMAGVAAGRAASNGLPIGAAMYLPDSSSGKLVLGDKSEWIRTGTLWASSVFPKLAALDGYKAHIFDATSLLGGHSVSRGFFSNGSNIFVGATASAGTVAVSTDSGASFSALSIATPAFNGVNQLLSVAFGAGVFVAVTNSGASVQIASSTNGTTWTNRLSHSTGAPTVDRNFVFWTGTVFVALVGYTTTTDGIWTSPDGITWTARNPTVSMGSVGSLVGAGVDGNISVVADGNWIVSANSGATWTSVATPPGVSVSTGTPMFRCGNVVVVPGGTPNGTISYTTTPGTDAAWTQLYAFPRAAAGFQYANTDVAGGFRGMLQFSNTHVAVSSDGINWTVQHLSRSGAVVGLAVGATSFVAAYSSNSLFRAPLSNLTNTNGVGTSVWSSGYSLYGSTSETALYVRAK